MQSRGCCSKFCSHTRFLIFFPSISAARSVADPRIEISPQNRVLKYSLGEAVRCGGEDMQTTNIQHLSGALTDGAQQLKLP